MAVTLTANFDIYNEETVRRLQEEDPDILPTYTTDKQKDLAYNKKQVTAAITSAVIQGKSIDKIADDLQTKMTSINRSGAIKTARTAVTSAQNGGTLASMKELAEMGIEVQKEWVATLDDRTRPSHRALDGQRRDLDKAFSNGLQYPGDSSGNAAEVWNCRCTMVSYIPEYDSDDEPRVTYAEWEEYKLATGSISRKITSEETSRIYSWVKSKAITSIRSSINQRNSSRGKAAAVVHFDVDLTTRQQQLLDDLPEYDSKTIVKKNEVSMSDLSALTAKTGVEFAMFTKGENRLIIRGDFLSVNITEEAAIQLSEEGYKWSGHTHPGIGENVLMASDNDYLILEKFRQKRSVIFNSMGEFLTFELEQPNENHL